MRFAIAAQDVYLDVLETLLEKQWTPVKLFASPIWVSSRYNTNHRALAHASQRKLPIQLSPITERDLADLAGRDCEVLVVAGHKWRIPDWRAHLPYAVNFHPSPLPEGRGRYPGVQVIREGRTQWGVACHKLANDFDSGDVLAVDTFPLSAADCQETLVLKTQMALGRLAARVADRFIALWNDATPQAEGSYWPFWTKADRVIDFDQPVAAVLRHVAAFGFMESIMVTNTAEVYVKRAVGWTESHDLQPGRIVHKTTEALVVAVRDGYVGLIDWRFGEGSAQ